MTRLHVDPILYLRSRLDEEEKRVQEALDCQAEHEADGSDVEWEWCYYFRRRNVPLAVWSAPYTAAGSPTPGRVLADIAAKRAILDAHTAAIAIEAESWQQYHDWASGLASVSIPGADEQERRIPGLELAVQHLLQPYRDRADFNPSWRLPARTPENWA